MNRYRHLSLVLLIGLVCLTGCMSKRELTPFRGDGCTLFPESSDRSGNDWSHCCEEHDVACWQGGTKEERQAVDLAFRECILENSNNEWLAEMMYNAIRIGGTPHFPSW
jgi:hypothetical protein